MLGRCDKHILIVEDDRVDVLIVKRAFQEIPVVVLTTSENYQDKLDSFNLGAAGNMLKPVKYRQFVEVLRIIYLCWKLSQFPDLRIVR